MPYIGEIKLGEQRVVADRWRKFIWSACEICGKERWVTLRRGLPRDKKCKHCASSQKREKAGGWKGGRIIATGGYIKIMPPLDDVLLSMADSEGYIAEHRYVIAKQLGRLLHPWEIVHHKNGIKDDNRIENLELFTRSDHVHGHTKGYQDGYMVGYLDGKTKKIKELQAKITELEVKLHGKSVS